MDKNLGSTRQPGWLKRQGTKLKKNFTMDTVPYYILYITAILLIGFIDVVDADFRLYRLVTGQYWSEVGMLLIANTLVLTGSLQLKINKLLNTDPDILEMNALLRKGRRNLEPDYSLYHHQQVNMPRKKIAYNKVISERINKLNKKAPQEARLQWLKQERIHAEDYDSYKFEINFHDVVGQRGFKKLINKIKNKWLTKAKYKKHLSYFLSMIEVKKMSTSTYIEENLEAIDVEYPEINESFIKQGVNTAYGSYDFMYEKDAARKFKDLYPRFVLNLGLGMFIASFVPMLKGGYEVIPLIVAISLKLIILAMNWNRGNTYAIVFLAEKFMVDCQYRLDKMMDYLVNFKGKFETAKDFSENIIKE